MADVIIIDTGAGISPAVMEFLVASPETILVTTPEPTSITDSYALLKALSMNENFKKDETTIKMIANRVDSEAEGRSLYEKLNVDGYTDGAQMFNDLVVTQKVDYTYEVTDNLTQFGN